MPANKNALIRYKTIDNCLRTVQGDLQIMRSDKLGYNAPIVVYHISKQLQRAFAFYGK